VLQLIDAYRLRKHTTSFDEMIKAFLAKHEGSPTELKTHAFINGDGGWSKINAGERKVIAELQASLTERARETNHLIAGLQKMLTPLLSRPEETSIEKP
jgi:hypothetical protein